jgi:hypothetical protein
MAGKRIDDLFFPKTIDPGISTPNFVLTCVDDWGSNGLKGIGHG